jgi:hypothetical protein
MELGLRRHDSAALQSTPQTPADCPAGDPHAAPAAARPILPRLVQTGEEIFRVDGICFQQTHIASVGISCLYILYLMSTRSSPRTILFSSCRSRTQPDFFIDR